LNKKSFPEKLKMSAGHMNRIPIYSSPFFKKAMFMPVRIIEEKGKNKGSFIQ